MKTLLIVYHSQSGCSARLAAAATKAAAQEEGVRVQLRRCWDATTADLATADGLLLIAAENSGSLSGGSKEFLDRVFYPAIEQQLVLPYALLVSAGNDGRGAVRQAERIFRGIPFPQATESQIIRGEGKLELATETGAAMAAGIVMGIF